MPTHEHEQAQPPTHTNLIVAHDVRFVGQLSEGAQFSLNTLAAKHSNEGDATSENCEQGVVILWNFIRC